MQEKITPPTRTSVRCRWRYLLELFDSAGLIGIVTTLPALLRECELCYTCIMVDTIRKLHDDEILENFDG